MSKENRCIAVIVLDSNPCPFSNEDEVLRIVMI